MAKKHSSAIVYVLVWVGLCVLTLLSFLFSRFDLGSAEIVIALVIAVAKSTLVGLFFMHLLEARRGEVAGPFLALAFITLLIGLVVTDVLTRHTFPKTPVEAVFPEGITPPESGPSR